MKEEQERGRVTAIRNRRLKAVENALKMAPALEQARREITAPTLRAFADWLNAHDYKTVKGKTWRAQTVSNLLSVDDLIIRDAEAEHDREVGIENELFERRLRYGQNAAIAKATRDQRIAESEQRLLQAKEQAVEIGAKVRGGRT